MASSSSEASSISETVTGHGVSSDTSSISETVTGHTPDIIDKAHPVFPKSIVKIGIFVSSHVVREIGLSLFTALRASYPEPELVNLTRDLTLADDTTLYIIVCPAGSIVQQQTSKPKYYIIYQFEPFGSPIDGVGKDGHPERHLRLFRDALAVWDFSMDNVERTRTRFKMNFAFVPPGYTNNWVPREIQIQDYLYSDIGKDIDVLFLGWVNGERRKHIRTQLYVHGLRIWFTSDLDIHGMCAAVRRSKICINVHTNLSVNSLETVRLNVLLSNQACIVSETSDDIEAVLRMSKLGVLFVPYDRIVHTCTSLITKPGVRKRMAIDSYRKYVDTHTWHKLVDFNKLLP